MISDQLLRTHPLISDQIEPGELSVLMCQLERLLKKGTTGNVVEFGCYAGTTSLFIRRLLDAYDFVGQYHVYDSFVGLPPKTVADMSAAGEQFVAGELSASRKLLVRNFTKAGLKLPIIHKAWFADLEPVDVPNDICFAFFDGDFYQSICDSFAACSDKFQPGAVIVVDDYTNQALPGAARATDEWCARHDVMVRTEQSLGIIQLPN